VAQASPWYVVFDGVAGQVRTQAFTARRVSVTRAHWWTPSLGAIRVEQAWLPVTIDGSDTNPWAWATYKNGTAAISPVRIPADKISLDGQLVVRAAALPEQALTVKIEAHLTPKKTWEGRATAEGPGIGLKADARFDPATKELAFNLPEMAVDLKPWQGFLQRLVLMPGGAMELAGQLTGSAQGTWSGHTLRAGGRVQLRDGRLANPARGITAEGVEVDLKFRDFDKFETEPGALRVRTVQVGQLGLSDIDAEFAFADPNKIVVSRATLKTLGGSVAAEPFRYFLNLRELDVVVLVDNISMAEVMALTRDLPAQASGRVDGRLPIHLDAGGLRLGTGWLALKPGVTAQIQFQAAGLLTRGVAKGSPSYSVLNKIESGLLKLRVGELRLDIRPPNVPAGRSAHLHVVGEPVDPDVKAPVTLDLNVNGPLEQLLNLGLDSRVSIGPGK
jgi:Dicarboxylate transport